MGNIVTNLKRFFSNKNTVTILGVILGLIVLFYGYNYRVEKAVEVITIPYAKTTINATTEITKENVGTKTVLKSMVSNSDNLINNINKILNTAVPYCVTTGTSIPAGGFFYAEQIDYCTNISNNPLKNMPDGYKPVSLPVDLHKTYGNSMYPGDYIDLYAKMETEDGKLIYGELIEKLPILDVRDSSGKSVFAVNGTTTTPAELLFAVPNYDVAGKNLYMLLSKAILLGDNVVGLIPVPGNASYTNNPGETAVKSNYLMDLIEQYTINVPDEQ